MGQKTNKIQNVIRVLCPICDKYVKTGVECWYCQIWFYFKCKSTTEKQFSKEYPAEQQYMCLQDQHQKLESTLQTQY